jgi:hypothetical protein
VTGLVQPRATHGLTCGNATDRVPLGQPGALGPEWKPVPGYSRYEASRNSLWTRGPGGKPVLASGGIRNAKGLLLAVRPSNKGYLLINLYDDGGVKRTLTVHKVILLAHAGECPAGQESLHEDDDPFDNRYPLKLYYGTHALNRHQRAWNTGQRQALPRPRRLRRVAAWLLKRH